VDRGLGDNLDATKIDAHYEAGVLTLSIPLAAHATPRRIPVTKRGGTKRLDPREEGV